MLKWIWPTTFALLLSFSWSMMAQVQRPTGLPSSPTQRGLVDADPVSISTGIYYRVYKDLYVKDTIPIDFVRTQRNMDPRSRSFGVGGSTSYDMFIIGDVKKFSWVALVMADGGQVKYSRVSPGTGVLDGVFEDKDDAGEFLGSRISWNGRGGWSVKLRDGREYTVQGCGPPSKPGQCAVTDIKNASGEHLTIQRDRDGNILRISSPHGHFIDIKHDTAGHIVHAQDDSGHWVNYSYDEKGCLARSFNWRGDAQLFRYDSRFNMIWVHEKGRHGRDGLGPYEFTVSNRYGADDRFASQVVSNGDRYSASYHTDAQARIRQTDVEDNYSSASYFFDEGGYLIREEFYRDNQLKWTLEYHFVPETHKRLNTTLSCGTRKTFLPPTFGYKIAQLGEAHKPFISEMCRRSATAKPSSEKKN
jgi:YD repeat-containing protein